jgi:hypothetical protein
MSYEDPDFSGNREWPDPFNDVASTFMPTSLENAFRWCYAPDTLVEYAHLQFKEIQHIAPGDLVPTKGGTLETVRKTSRRSVNERIVTLVVNGFGKNLPTRLTASHKLWVIRNPGLKRTPNIANLELVAAGELSKGDYIFSPTPFRSNPPVAASQPPGWGHKLPRFSGWLFGIYIAEGCKLANNNVLLASRFTLGRDDEHTGILARVIREASEQTGTPQKSYTPLQRPEIRCVTVHDVEMPSWMIEHCDEHALDKKLSPCVYGYDDDFLLDMLAGWIDGDGWVSYTADRKLRGLHGCTSSKILAYQMMRIAELVGLCPTLCCARARLTSFGKTSASYQLNFNAGDALRFVGRSEKLRAANIPAADFQAGRTFLKNVLVEGGILRRVVSATQYSYSGDVCNFEVANDHSYIANGALGANCEYILLSDGVYRSAIDRVVSYFITDVQIEGTDRESKDKYVEFLNNTLGIHALLRTVALDYLCLHGDTLVPTRNGVYPIRNLVGQTVDVISQGGVYRPARFKHYGRQELLEVVFSDGRKVLATPEHQWIIKNLSDKEARVPTSALRKGHRIERTVAPRPEKNADYHEGVCHGFVFGDGSPAKLQKRRGAIDLWKIHGLPAHYKQLPATDASASYWYGFVAGFLAADGSVDTHGCCVLTQKSRAALEAIEAQLPRIGMVAGPIRSQEMVVLLPEYKGVRRKHALTMHYMTLLKRFMTVEDLLIESHIRKFSAGTADTAYGKYVMVKSVSRTGIVDDVYCCEEPETHSFVIDNGIITSNCYGNFFCSVIVPFRRSLSCPGCGFEAPLKQIHGNQKFGFSWTGYEFSATCPFCQYGGKWTHIDRRATQEDDVIVKRWNPHELDLIWDPYTDQVSHIWKIPPHLKQYVAKGTLFHLERTPYEVLQAIKNNNHIQFDKDVVYHGKEPTLCGILNKGWGISRVLTNFRQAWYLQVLRRYNEAIGLDYIIPFRVITPMPRAGNNAEGMSDPLFTSDFGGITQQINGMLRQRKRNPTSWFSLPFPVQYQALGAEAASMAPHELMDQALDTLLTAVGVPVEFYKGSLTIQAAPAALRLMESNWSHLTRVLNNFLQWLVNKISIALNWDEVTATLERPQHADDLQRQLAKLQLMMGQQISQTTGLKSVGLVFEDEQKRMQEEQKFVAEEGQKTQEDLQAAGLGEQMAQGQQPGQPGAQPGQPGDPSQGGAPPAGGSPQGDAASGQAATAPVDPIQAVLANIPPAGQAQMPPQELEQLANAVAQQVFALQPSQRIQALRQLKQKNPTIHSLVKSLLESLDQQAKAKGKQLGQQQAQQTQQQSMAPPPGQGMPGGAPPGQ